MKLLIVTQKVDATDSNLGFFVRWIEEFAKYCEQVTVICLEEGKYHCPENVQVCSLGKDRFTLKDLRFKLWRRLLYAVRFVRYIVRKRKEYDSVFVHMNPEYALLGGLFWRLAGKKSALWYVHKEVNWRLRLAALLVDRIFTASPESCRLRSRKVEVVGHGIDVSYPTFDFRKSNVGDCDTTNVAHTNKIKPFPERTNVVRGLRLLTVGRIVPVKDLRTLILGFMKLRERFPEAEMSIVGEPITERDRAYLTEIRRIASSGVRFCGGVSHEELPRLYAEATAFVHASRTGSIDKAVLEALAVGLPVFTSSEAFSGEIPAVTKFEQGNPENLAEKIAGAFERGHIGYNERARAWVAERHNLARLIQHVLAFFVAP